MFPIETISAKMLDYYVERPDTLIIDLREPESYRKSHIRGAVNIPYERKPAASERKTSYLLLRQGRGKYGCGP